MLLSENNSAKHIALIGYYGFDNIGDEVLLEVIIKNWQAASNNTNLWIFYNNQNIAVRQQDVSASSLGLNFIPRDNLFDIIRIFVKTKIFIFGGGSLLQNSTSNRSIFYYLGMIFLAKLFGNKVVLLAQGIGPIKGKLPKLLTYLVLKFVDKITCRDKDSIDLLNTYGINKAELTADLAYLMEPPPSNLTLKSSLQSTGEGTLSVSKIGVIIREVASFTDEQVVSFVLDTIRKHAPWSYIPELILIPFQPEDMSYCKRINQKLEAESKGLFKQISVYSNKILPSQILEYLAQFSLVISMRLHGLIFAKIAGVPYEGIVYDPKVKAFLEDKRSIEELRKAALTNLD